MAIQFNNSSIRRRNPITRNDKFFSKEDFDLEVEFSKEYMEQDANQTVILYEVDMDKTKVDDIYQEAEKGAIRFKQPIELPVVFTIDEAEMKSYDTKQIRGRYSKIGKLTFGVLYSTLDEYECDIKRGDYIGVQVTPEHIEYWTVTDDGKVDSYANKNTLYGTRPLFRNISCAPVDANEFNG